MKRTIAVAVVLAFTVAVTTPCFADFQYTEQSKVTGGSLAGAMKVAGVFSKDAKQATQGTNMVVSLKGNRMRREDSFGNAEIIDLEGRRIIHVDSRHKTYSIITFDQMKAQLQEAQRKAAEQQAKSKGEKTQVKIVPKVQISPGKSTRKVLGYTAKETKVRVDMEMQSEDPKHKGESATFWLTSDGWIAPVKGYEEVKRFGMKLAKELDWAPGAVFGGNAQMAPVMVEYKKDMVKLDGLPLLQYLSVGGQDTGQAAQSNNQSQPSSPGGAVVKGIGGLFGKRKKKEDEAAQQNSGDSGSSTASANSLMDMTVEVTAISNNALDSSLFEIPQGYKQVESKEGKKR